MASIEPAEITVKIKLDFSDLISSLRTAADQLEAKFDGTVNGDVNDVQKAIDVASSHRWAWG